MTLSGTTTPSQSGYESNGNEGVLHTRQSSRTGVSPSKAVYWLVIRVVYYIKSSITRVDAVPSLNFANYLRHLQIPEKKNVSKSLIRHFFFRFYNLQRNNVQCTKLIFFISIFFLNTEWMNTEQPTLKMSFQLSKKRVLETFSHTPYVCMVIDIVTYQIASLTHTCKNYR